jgi:hypothetical protein
MIARLPSFAKHWDGIKDRIVFSDEKENIGTVFITSYHVDSEIGLRLLVDTIKKYNL